MIIILMPGQEGKVKEYIQDHDVYVFLGKEKGFNYITGKRRSIRVTLPGFAEQLETVHDRLLHDN